LTSLINFAAINENFPVAGQDNDTQVFRDNFDTIKTNFSVAKTDIEDLQDNVARKDTPNDFNGSLVQNAVFLNNTETVNPAQTFEASLTTYTLDYENGSYQIFTFASGSFTFDFLNFPQLGENVAKMTVEMRSSTSTTVAFSLSGSGAGSIKKNSSFPGTLTVASATNPVIIEIWRHSEGNFFMNYLGSFS
jgi:hypothetical protein